MLIFCSQDRKLLHVISFHRNEQNIGRAMYHCLQVTALGSSQGASMWGLKTKSCHPGGRKMGSSRHPPLATKFRASQDFIRARTENQTEKMSSQRSLSCYYRLKRGYLKPPKSREGKTKTRRSYKKKGKGERWEEGRWGKRNTQNLKSQPTGASTQPKAFTETRNRAAPLSCSVKKAQLLFPVFNSMFKF